MRGRVYKVKNFRTIQIKKSHQNLKNLKQRIIIEILYDRAGISKKICGNCQELFW